jgi:hypothetical protein
MFFFFPCRVYVCCSQLATEKALTIRQALSSYISEALDHAPSVVILDDLDSIVSSSSDSEGSQPSTSVVALTEFLTDIMDEYGVVFLFVYPTFMFNVKNLKMMLMLELYYFCFFFPLTYIIDSDLVLRLI